MKCRQLHATKTPAGEPLNTPQPWAAAVQRRFRLVRVVAAGILALTMGSREFMDMVVGNLNTSTGLALAASVLHLPMQRRPPAAQPQTARNVCTPVAGRSGVCSLHRHGVVQCHAAAVYHHNFASYVAGSVAQQKGHCVGHFAGLAQALERRTAQDA
jgi:hypothetical protein